MTRTLDELIKARIAEGRWADSRSTPCVFFSWHHILQPCCRFDDVVRVAAAPLETKRTTVELDDKKPQQVGQRAKACFSLCSASGDGRIGQIIAVQGIPD